MFGHPKHLYEKPRQLNAIIDLLKNADFDEANYFFAELTAKFFLTAKERKRLEVIAVESVRPIPATTQPQNRMPSWDHVYSLLEVVSGDASLCSFGLAVSSLLTMLRHVLPT